MSEHLLTELTVFILAVFVGIEVISKVPTTLHTPLMSATNAIHGIVLVGAILVAGVEDPKLGWFLSIVVVTLASLNVFGGFTVTERMLQMFKPRATPRQGRQAMSDVTVRNSSSTRLPHHRHLLHRRPAAVEQPEDGPPRQSDRGRRHVRRRGGDGVQMEPSAWWIVRDGVVLGAAGGIYSARAVR